MDHDVLSFETAEFMFKNQLDQLPTEIRQDFDKNALPVLTKYGYFDFPASIRYHLNQEGGLFRHSVRVAQNAQRLNDIWFHYPNWKVILAGLFHDLGKLGNIDFYSGSQHPRYKRCEVFQKIKDQTPANVFIDKEVGFTYAVDPATKKRYYPFKYGAHRDDKTYVHADLTILDGALPLKIMNLPADVVQACQFADGHYVSANDHLKLKAHPLAYLTHWADMYTGILEEGGWMPFAK